MNEDHAPLDENKLIAQRREKLARLREQGIAFPNDFRRNVVAGERHAEYDERTADEVESLAVRRLFGSRADQVPMSSIKSMIGHTMGAASAIEAVACALAIHTGIAPPTINYVVQDPECDLDYVPNQARKVYPRVVVPGEPLHVDAGQNIMGVVSME